MNHAFYALLLALGVGTAAAASLWIPRSRQIGNAAPLIVFLGLGIGLVVTAQIYFLAAAWFPAARGGVSTVVECALAAAGLATAWLRARRNERRGADHQCRPSRAFSGCTFLLATLFAQMALAALVAAARRARGAPFGDWDGWAIWNMHARFLWRAPAEWMDLLRKPGLTWSHPDYPLAISAAVARLWTWIGSDAGWAGGAISLLFAVATTGMLVAGLSRARRPALGLIFGIVLIGTRPFVLAAASQQADMPVAFFLLACAVTLTLAESEPGASEGPGAVCGLCAGLALGVKNEGWLLALVVSAAWLMRQGWRQRGQARFWVALAVAALPTIYFKGWISPRNDLLASQPWHRWEAVFDRERFELIAAAFGHNLVPAAAVLVLLVLLVVAGRAKRAVAGGAAGVIDPGYRGPAAGGAGLILGGMLGGYCLVYLLTPYDLSWHLNHSLDRLLLQLWPCALWFAGLMIPSATAPNGVADVLAARWKRTTWALANAVLAGVLVLLFSEQRAVNEFSYAWLNGARVSAVLDPGWFSAEENAHDRWAWTGGEGSIDIVSASGRPNVAVDFALRSLTPRQVTVRWSRGVLWSGRVGTDLDYVHLRPVPFANGSVHLEFSSREPAVLEGKQADARRLAFAVYDLNLK